MQSKPESSNVLYLAFNGHQINGPFFPPLGGPAYSWVAYCNVYDIDSTYIGVRVDKWKSTLNVPAANPNLLSEADKIEIFNIVVKKFEIFDINVTTLKNVYEAASGKRHVCIITARPTPDEFNYLTINNDETENSPWPYSYRRFLLGYTTNSGNRRYYSNFIPMGFAANTDDLLTSINPFGRNEKLETFAFVNGNAAVSVEERANVYAITDANKYLQLTQSNWDERVSNKRIAETIVHEIGHNFILEHDGDNNDEYYRGHDIWGTLMGSPDDDKHLAQWDKGEYKSSDNNQNDVVIIARNIDLLKRPKNKNSLVLSSDFADFEKDEWPQELGYNIRNITSSDVITTAGGSKAIEGMIGFPYDFDILKILLKGGSKYRFWIDRSTNQDKYSMLDVEMNILNCHCHESKSNNPQCNAGNLPTIYPKDLSSDKIHCISYKSKLDSTKFDYKKHPENDGYKTVLMDIDLKYTSIVYLQIRGGKNKTPSDGWSRYGSVGKYNLQITAFGKVSGNDPSTFLPSKVTPKSRCEDFYYCNSSQIKKIPLYIQDQSESGDGNIDEANIIKVGVCEDGDGIVKKFLVYGQPVGKDAPEEAEKFYLPITKDQLNRKQEFVTGHEDWESEKETV